MTRLTHVIIGCWLAGAFLVISISAYYLLKKKHFEFAKKSLAVALSVAVVSSFLQLAAGDRSAKVVAKHQPAKLAALEAVYQTQESAPLTLFGVVNSAEEKIDYAVQIPGLLSFLSFGDSQATIKGLDQVPKSDWPNVTALFNVYRLMLGLWGVMTFLSIAGAYYMYRGSLPQKKWLLWLMVPSAIFAQLANQAGWYCAETGRYPWIVYNQLRISEGLSKSVTAGQVFSSILMFGFVYTLLFILFIYLTHQKIKNGPDDGQVMDDSLPYHDLKTFVQEKEISK